MHRTSARHGGESDAGSRHQKAAPSRSGTSAAALSIVIAVAGGPRVLFRHIEHTPARACLLCIDISGFALLGSSERSFPRPKRIMGFGREACCSYSALGKLYRGNILRRR